MRADRAYTHFVQKPAIRRASAWLGRWSPAIVLILLCVTSAFVRRTLSRREQARVLEGVRNSAHAVRQEIDTQLAYPVMSLQRMAARWEDSNGTPERAWQSDADRLVHDFPIYREVAFVDSQGVIRRSAPSAYRSRYVGQSIVSDSTRIATLRRAQKARDAVASPALTLLSGGKGFSICEPIFTGARLDGYLFAEIEFETFFNYIRRDLTQVTAVLEQNGERVFSDANAGATRWDASETISLPGELEWRLHVSPSARYLRQLRTGMTDVVFLFSLICSLLVSFALWFALRAREKARAAGEAISAKARFLTTITREIRAPLNALVGMAGLLSGTPLTAEQRKCTETLRSNGDILLGAIDDIVDFSKIESGTPALEETDFDLRRTVEESADLLSPRIQGKGLEFILNIDDNVPNALKGDPARLRQTLVNLLGNAAKFTEKGEVELRVSGKNKGGAEAVVRFSVRDTGSGLAPEAVSRLFQP